MFRKIYIILTLILTSHLSFLYSDGLQEDIDRAEMIIREFKESPEKSIPRKVLRDAKGLAILNVIKVALLLSGRGGTGLVIAKNTGEWSAPSAIGMGGAGVGAQIGAEVSELILVLNTDEAVRAFTKGGNFILGTDLSVAAGPNNQSAEKEISPTAIYTYSRSHGLFAGASLEGTIIAERKEANAQFYGRPLSAATLLSGEVPRPESASALYAELESASQPEALSSLLYRKLHVIALAAIVIILALSVLIFIRKKKANFMSR